MVELLIKLAWVGATKDASEPHGNLPHNDETR